MRKYGLEAWNNKKSRLVLKITIIGNTASLFLINNGKKIIAESKWEDNKDLSERLLEKVDFLLKKKKLSLSDISKVDFFCDFPYYKSKRKNIKIANVANKKPKKTCGFTAWQTGEITTKVLNFFKLRNHHFVI